MSKMNIFKHITLNGEEETFDELAIEKPLGTSTLVGSPERVQVYRRRLERMQELFCDDDTVESKPPNGKVMSRSGSPKR